MKDSKNILFIYPMLEESESLAIQYLSSGLKKQGHKVNLIVYHKGEKYFKKRLKKRIENFQPDFIGFSAMTDDYAIVCKIAKFVKTITNAFIIVGGIQATSCPDEVISNDFVDYIVLGEGDDAIIELIENPQNTKIKNIWMKKNKKIIKNSLRPLIQNLDTLPFPDKELFVKEAPYLKEIYHCITSKGCPFHCTYCFNNFMKKLYSGEKWLRKRSVNSVITELKIMKKKIKFKQVLFLDDCFTSDKKWLIEFLKKYKKEINVPFKAISHPALIDAEVLSLLKKAKCTKVKIGVQTPIEKIRKDICKRNETNKLIRKIVNEIKKQKIMVEIDHIFGLPSEKAEDYKQGLEFYIGLKPNIFSSFWLQYYPNTEIIEIGKKFGDVDDESINKIIKGDIRYGDTMKKRKSNPELLAISRFMCWIPLLPQNFSRFLLKKNLYPFIFRYDIFNSFPYLIQHFSSLNSLRVVFSAIKRKLLLKKLVSKLNSKYPKTNSNKNI